MAVLKVLAGVPVGVSPKPRKRSWISGIFTILTISVLGRSTIASGVLAGVKTPCHELPITPFTSSVGESSVIVGTSGKLAMRSAPEIPSALILPALIEGIAVVYASKYILTTPLITSGPGLVL